MKVRDIERLLAANGIGKAKMDVITRRLREAHQLPVAARGLNAPELTGSFAAKVLIATAGSAKGVSADRRLQLLRGLTSDRDSGTKLLSRLGRLLEGSPELDQVAECRIGRNVREASILYADGQIEKFSTTKPPDYSFRLRTEGTIPGDLLRQLATSIANGDSIPNPDTDEDPDND